MTARASAEGSRPGIAATAFAVLALVVALVPNLLLADTLRGAARAEAWGGIGTAFGMLYSAAAGLGGALLAGACYWFRRRRYLLVAASLSGIPVLYLLLRALYFSVF